MAKFRRALIEIGNVCNLSCSFCAKSKRKAVFMTAEQFEYVAKQVNEFAKVISLHLLGEPLLHPNFPDIVAIAEKLGLGLNLVTNGTLAGKYGSEVWGRKCFRQVTFSIQSLTCFSKEVRTEKVKEYINFAKKNSQNFKVSFRLRGNLESPFVKDISKQFMLAFGHVQEWKGEPFSLADRVFLNHGELFVWRGARPKQGTCLGLRHHFGILSDGSVVPCCADYDGEMTMGNIFNQPLAKILNSQNTLLLRQKIEGKNGTVPEYCSNCGFLMP